ncbi:MAG: bifunctional pyr operon transcriptional regulator/uracil phosphoribosyltransferase PyrR [Flavobacteriales bacterium TMED191]|nr:MAG: bifunctional pyr operon transcriptional regulator/uracil phosphoribosyltransferase PyrR [Flavobacteriales bacterium TMED191]
MSKTKKVILNSRQLNLTVKRLSFEIIENHITNIDKCVIIGLQPRGVELACEIHNILELNTGKKIKIGHLDTTFFRDDFRRRDGVILPNVTSIDFSIEDLNIVLVDDVLFTGRSVRSALDALITFGRPNSVELLVLIDRRFSRELPIQPQYIGRSVDVIDNEHVVVNLNEVNSNVILLNQKS